MIPTDAFRYKESEEERAERERIKAIELSNREKGKDAQQIHKLSVVRDFYRDFKTMKSREPFIDEVINNLADRVSLTESEVRVFLKKISDSNASFGESIV